MSFEDRNKPCVICQSSEFVWGLPESYNGLWFRPDNDLENQLGQRSSVLGRPRYGLESRVCRGCGNVQFFMRYYPQSEKKKNR